MTTEVHEGVNGNLKKTEVEPLGEIKEDVKKPANPANAGDVNGKVEESGCESLAGKEEPLTKNGGLKQKVPLSSVEDEEDEDEVNEPQDGNNYSSEDEEGDGEGDEDVRGEAEPYEEEDEEYADDGEEDDEGDDDESEPPSKRRK